MKVTMFAVNIMQYILQNDWPLEHVWYGSAVKYV